MFWKKLFKKRTPGSPDTNIGNVLILMGLITQVDLSMAVTAQNKRGGYIGEVLISLGSVTRDELETGLCVQEQLRAGHEVDAQFQMADEQIRQRRQTVDSLRNLTVQNLEKLA